MQMKSTSPGLVSLALLYEISYGFCIEYRLVEDGRLNLRVEWDVVSISKHLRNPKKAKMNMTSSVRASTQGRDTFGEDF